MPTRQPPQAAAQATVFPVIADWAYETRPNTPIRAGETRPDDEPEMFTVDFENPDGTFHRSGLTAQHWYSFCRATRSIMKWFWLVVTRIWTSST